eukprot:scaffold3332_cov130-Isochrysis_galbana.AAC.4
MDVHDRVVRLGGRRSGARVSGRVLHANPKIGFPTDDTEAREQDAPDTTGAKHRAPLHGHTGAVPLDKALSDSGSASIRHAARRLGSSGTCSTVIAWAPPTSAAIWLGFWTVGLSYPRHKDSTPSYSELLDLDAALHNN